MGRKTLDFVYCRTDSPPSFALLIPFSHGLVLFSFIEIFSYSGTGQKKPGAHRTEATVSGHEFSWPSRPSPRNTAIMIK
jgi:hypothetical protein